MGANTDSCNIENVSYHNNYPGWYSLFSLKHNILPLNKQFLKTFTFKHSALVDEYSLNLNISVCFYLGYNKLFQWVILRALHNISGIDYKTDRQGAC